MAAELRLDGSHAIRVTESGAGAHAEPVTATEDGWARAAPGDGAGLAVLHRLRNRSAVEDGFRVTATAWVPPDDDSERAMGVDQTNESWVVGGRVVVKWVTDDLDGPHPGADRLRRLADAGFVQTPALVGLVEWQSPGGDWAPVAVVQEYVPGAEDGWTWMVREARRALGLDSGRPDDPGAELGALTARMHLALAGEPAEVTSYELAAAQAADARAVLERAIAATATHDPQSHALLVGHRPRIEAELAALDGLAGSPAVAVHGDLHVGQVLRTPDGGFHVIDFDGNPTRPPALRAAVGPAARDVASMLMAFENVAEVTCHHALDGVEAADAVDPAALTWTARAWTGHTQGRFLDGYRRTLGDRRDLYDAELLPAFDWEQLCREFVYAAQHLPSWLYVPRAALLRRFGA